MYEPPEPEWMDVVPAWLVGPFKEAIKAIYLAGFRDGVVTAAIAALVITVAVLAIRSKQ